jgi:exosortase O
MLHFLHSPKGSEISTASPSPLSPARALRWGANALIAGLWLWLYRPVFDYLAVIFSREDFRANQVALVGVLVLIGVQLAQARKKRPRLRLDAAPQLSAPALGLALGGSALYLAVERFLDINTLSASLFGLATYGLLGLWLEPRRWRQGLLAALLLIATLPFGEHMQTFIGYPVRILTASTVRDGLAAAGVTSVSMDTILVLENGVSQVDLPCSGVKSLWTGMLFLLAATWIERRALNLRWALTALAFATLLLAANLARVGILVVVGQVAGWRLAAEMLHVPLGVLGFATACAVAAALVRRQPAPGDEPPGQAVPAPPGQAVPAPPRPVWLAPLLGVAILAMALVYAPHPQTGLAQPPPDWEFPAELVTTPMPLKPDEVAWLTRGGAESADRRHFTWRGASGSMILITSTTWRAQHRPERCFEVYGLSLEDSRPYLVAPDLPVRLVLLSDRARMQVSAAYWFQSAGRTTDDYATRIWADLAPQRERWVLVSILFDNVRDPRAPDIQALYAALHAAVARSLGGDISKEMAGM